MRREHWGGSADEVCEEAVFLRRQGRVGVDLAEEPGHIAAEGAHSLEAFGIVEHLAVVATVGDVPVLRRNHGHVEGGEVFVYAVDGVGRAGTPAYGHSRRGFIGQELTGGVGGIEQTVEQGAERTVGTTEVDGRSDNEGVGGAHFLADGGIRLGVEDAHAGALTLHAGRAAGNGALSDPHYLGFDTFADKGCGYFREGFECVSVVAGTAVDQYDFHRWVGDEYFGQEK